jgi:hypothetical protein
MNTSVRAGDFGADRRKGSQVELKQPLGIKKPAMLRSCQLLGVRLNLKNRSGEYS